MSGIPFGNYELVERIAEGGMAEVWRARSRGVAGFEKAVVIKRVLPSLLERPGFAELLIREAKIAARLSHPNIVQIFDLGEQDGSYFIAMELLRGRDLAAALSFRRAGEAPLDLAVRLWIGAEVAKALDYAHRARFDDGKPMNIVHRDVSPQNVLLGYEGEVKVADFGIARADEPGLGRGEDPKILRGKYAYMSPEQARGEVLDRRSDLFSLGILLYELATRRRMFHGLTAPEILSRVRATELPDFRRHLPIEELAPVIERALARERADRYASAGEIHAELTQLIYALGRPVGATDLAAAMHRMFPRDERLDPNKLRVDLLERAYDDAAAASDPGRELRSTGAAPDSTAHTHVLPIPRRAKSESRRLAFLAARLRPGEEGCFASAVARAAGALVPAVGEGLHLAVFGVQGMERAVGHAIRGALEVRRAVTLEGAERLHATPAMAVIGAEAQVLDGAAKPSAEVEAAARALLAATADDEVRVASALAAEVGREFVTEPGDGALLVRGFRARRDRAAGALRMRGPHVGRRELLRELSARLLDAAAGRGALVELVGEPGVGKSRLLAELRAAAAPRDFVFVHGRADETDGDRAFGAFADLVMDLCGVEAEDAPEVRFAKVERMRVLGLAPHELRRLGELVGLAYPVASDAREGRPRGIELALALRKAVRALSRDRVVVLALEDLHWMDDATRQVLPLLVNGLGRCRVVVLVSRRPGVSGLASSDGDVRVIEPLDPGATAALAAHHLGARAIEPALAAHVHALTGGIPAWIELVAEALRESVAIEGGVARRRVEELPDVAPPAPLVASVAARLEPLRARERSMLRVVAAMGEAVEVRLVCATEGLVGETEQAPLRRLWARHLVVGPEARGAPPARIGSWGGHGPTPSALPAEVSVPGALVRRAILAELEPAERARLHARIVATLERVGGDASLEGVERIAEHAARSLDPRGAPDYFVRAGEMARARGELARAARHFIEAARVLRATRGPLDPSAFERGLDAAAAALDAGMTELAELALGELAEAAPALDAPLRVRHAIATARCARRGYAQGAALAALAAVEPVLADVDAELRDQARALTAWTLAQDGQPARALVVIDRLVEEGTGASLAAALALRATALARLDRLDEADAAA
ncbi:MAG: protein kinase, partial [Sandaracinaceae bacterium]|nr:protein kinase [Sandaracinaceae bacterium]